MLIPNRSVNCPAPRRLVPAPGPGRATGRALPWRLPLLALVLLCACGPVRFAGAYDEIVDRGTSDLHTRVVSFVTAMVSASGTPAGTYESNVSFYNDAKGTLATLKMRARIQDQNEITVKLLQELEGNVERLRQLHAMGKDHGLTKSIADLALPAIETNFEGIIRFEVAKRRGQTGTHN
jgi:hypothetical protein